MTAYYIKLIRIGLNRNYFRRDELELHQLLTLYLQFIRERSKHL